MRRASSPEEAVRMEHPARSKNSRSNSMNSRTSSTRRTFTADIDSDSPERPANHGTSVRARDHAEPFTRAPYDNLRGVAAASAGGERLEGSFMQRPDPHSFFDPGQARSKHLSLRMSVDFDRR